jgi:hypothetical protein
VAHSLTRAVPLPWHPLYALLIRSGRLVKFPLQREHSCQQGTGSQDGNQVARSARGYNDFADLASGHRCHIPAYQKGTGCTDDRSRTSDHL